AGPRPRRAELALDDAEVGKLDLAATTDEHVARSDVAVNDPQTPPGVVLERVNVLEGGEHLVNHVERAAEAARDAALLGELERAPARHAIDVLEHHHGLVAESTELEQLENVRVRRPRVNGCLVLKELDELRIQRQVG